MQQVLLQHNDIVNLVMLPMTVVSSYYNYACVAILIIFSTQRLS